VSYIKLDARRQALVCKLYAESGRLCHSANAAGMTAAAVITARKRWPEFDEALKEAYSKFQDSIEQEAHARAVEGWQEPVFYQGAVVGTVLKKSDRILELMLKRHIPMYRDHQHVDMNVTGGVLVVPQVAKSDEEWEKEHGAAVPPT